MHNYRSEGFPNKTPWFEFTGLKTTGHGPQEPISLSFVDKESPILGGLAEWTTVKEELYNNIRLFDTATPIARGKQTYKARNGAERTSDFVVVWSNLYGPKKTRVFSTTIGHNNATVEDPKYLDLVARGVLWATGHLNEDGTPAQGYAAQKK